MLGVRQGPLCQELPKLPWDAQAAQSFAELGDHGNTERGVDLPAGATHGYFYFIHSLVRWIHSALFRLLGWGASTWRTPAQQQDCCFCAQLEGWVGRVAGEVLAMNCNSPKTSLLLYSLLRWLVWFYFSFPKAVLAIKSFKAWISRACTFRTSPLPISLCLTSQAGSSRFYFQKLQWQVIKMPLWQLLPSTELVILPKVGVWHKQGKVCALHLTCVSIFPGKAWQGLLQKSFNGFVWPWSASSHQGTVNLTTCVPHTAAPCAALLRQLSHHCLPLCLDPFRRASRRRFSMDPPLLLEGHWLCCLPALLCLLKALLLIVSAFVNSFPTRPEGSGREETVISLQGKLKSCALADFEFCKLCSYKILTVLIKVLCGITKNSIWALLQRGNNSALKVTDPST